MKPFASVWKRLKGGLQYEPTSRNVKASGGHSLTIQRKSWAFASVLRMGQVEQNHLRMRFVAARAFELLKREVMAVSWLGSTPRGYLLLNNEFED